MKKKVLLILFCIVLSLLAWKVMAADTAGSATWSDGTRGGDNGENDLEIASDGPNDEVPDGEDWNDYGFGITGSVTINWKGLDPRCEDGVEVQIWSTSGGKLATASVKPPSQGSGGSATINPGDWSYVPRGERPQKEDDWLGGAMIMTVKSANANTKITVATTDLSFYWAHLDSGFWSQPPSERDGENSEDSPNQERIDAGGPEDTSNNYNMIPDGGVVMIQDWDTNS